MKYKLDIKYKLKMMMKVALITIFINDLSFAQSENSDSLSNLSSDTSAENNTPSPDDRGLTNFEWDPMPGAKFYEVEITPQSKMKDNSGPLIFKVETTSWTGKLTPGNYTMRLRSKDKRDVPGEWSESTEFNVKVDPVRTIFPNNKEEISSNETELFECEFKWIRDEFAKLYEITIKDVNGRELYKSSTEENFLKYKLPVAAKYSWSIVAFDFSNQKGKSLQNEINFTILGEELKMPMIITPETPYVRQLTWSPSEKNDVYKLKLQRKDNSSLKWKDVEALETKDTSIEFQKKWKGGQYKLSVSAIGNLRIPSKTHTIIFPVAKGDRSAAAEARARLRQAIDRTNGWYLIGSYLVTQIQYESQNLDYGSIISTSAFGGTGRLGAGYLSSETVFGFLGIVDLSGFIIGQKNYTYPSLEGHGIMRFKSGSRGEFRGSAGLYYKEVPEILANGKTGEVSKVTQLGAMGMHAGGEYWHSMSTKLGLQVNTRFYYPMSGKTPNGQGIIPTMSYQFGFLGSYRLNQKMTGLMGYVYRKDITNYKTTNSSDLPNGGISSNQSSIVGQYLNFFLEWNL